ncbi:MAG: hypothetical protein ABGY71_15045 [bacterium]|jgi:hypothetical protein|nr:GNAT family N-acetyltransferase [Planctomycetota bacterium]HIL51582.1 GNAT family N-acetyltransferase [Planctomycetota bacterium]
MTSIEIRPLVQEDLPALARCHERVFGAAEAHAEETLAWGTCAVPAGPRAFVAQADGRIVGAYLGRAQATWIGGELRAMVQSVDSMIDPEYRAGLKRPGLFVNLARAYFDEYGVRGEDLVHYGWPLEKAWRIGERFLEYRLLREELVLVREVGASVSRPPGVERLEEFGPDLKWLWDRCATSFGAAAVRDAAWARWRFLDHPTNIYTPLGLRDDDGHLRGMCVMREGAWAWPGAAAVCDWLVPDTEPEVFSALEAAACAHAREQGAERLVILVPCWSDAFARFQACGWRVQPSPYRCVARSFDKRFDLAWLRQRWWTTLADSDLA